MNRDPKDLLCVAVAGLALFERCGGCDDADRLPPGISDIAAEIISPLSGNDIVALGDALSATGSVPEKIGDARRGDLLGAVLAGLRLYQVSGGGVDIDHLPVAVRPLVAILSAPVSDSDIDFLCESLNMSGTIPCWTSPPAPAWQAV